MIRNLTPEIPWALPAGLRVAPVRGLALLGVAGWFQSAGRE